MRPDLILWLAIGIPFLSVLVDRDPGDENDFDSDIYAFRCSTCGMECFDGEGDGETCDDCLFDEEIEEFEAEEARRKTR